MESNEAYMKEQYTKIGTSDPLIWEQNMPVVLKNHPSTENGYFLYIEEDGKL